MLKNQLSSKSNINMAYMPEIADLHHFMSSVLEHPGKSINISWVANDKVGMYILTLTSIPLKSDPEWHLILKKGIVKKTIWQHSTCDILLINNLLISSCNAQRQEIVAEGNLATSEMHRGRSATADEFFIKSSMTGIKAIDPNNLPESNQPNLSHSFGDLSILSLVFVLRSLNGIKATGKLKLTLDEHDGYIYLVDGEIVHAELNGLIGIDAFFSLLEWEKGVYSFEPLLVSQQRSLDQNFEALIMTGIRNKEDAIFLKNNNITTDTVLARRNPNLSDKEFENLANTGANIDNNFQLSFYKYIDDRTKLSKIIESTHLSRDRWMAVVVNLIKCGIISTVNESSWGKAKKPVLRPKSVDINAIDSVMMALRQIETGLFSYPAFLYFLEQEFFRSYRQGAFFSMLNIQIWKINPDGSQTYLLLNELNEAIRRISKLKRFVDIFAHNDNNDYVILLPNTTTKGALIFAHRIVRELRKNQLSESLPTDSLKIAIGIAGIPEDTKELGILLASCEFAKNQAQANDSEVVSFNEFG